jgi:class 3 adenylate cyclase
MEPHIQYAKTSDGVSIAYAVFGDGPPIVYIGTGFGDIHLYSPIVTRLTKITDALVGLGRRGILYDARGTGSSDRGDFDFSLEARLRDLEAVVERVGLERFALWCLGSGGPIGIAYTARHADRVSRLVLVATYANGADWYGVIPAMRAGRAADTMAEEQWEYHTLLLANAATGFRDSDLANRLAALFRSGTSATEWLSTRNATEKIDVTDLLPLVSVPTLVVHITSSPISNVDLLRVLASRIPNARLISTEDLPGAIDAFLREGEESAAAPRELPSGMTAILFADIADSTALTERLGDTAFREKARGLDGALRGIIRENDGTPIEGKLLGDGVLAVFTSARQAIEAALACGRAGDDASLPLHLGIHAGDVIREQNNVYGGAVNIASRICAISVPGEILVSDVVRGMARSSAGVEFEDRGEQEMKGVGEPVRVFAVREDA